MKALNVNQRLGATSDGTAFQRGYKYGLLVARGQAKPAEILADARGDWEQGYRMALNSEAVRLAGPRPPKVAEHE